MVISLKPEWNDPIHSDWNEKKAIPFRPEWNGPFRSGRNEMAHSIPAGMKCSIPAGMKWSISFRPEWNAHSVDANKKYASWTEAVGREPLPALGWQISPSLQGFGCLLLGLASCHYDSLQLWYLWSLLLWFFCLLLKIEQLENPWKVAVMVHGSLKLRL